MGRYKTIAGVAVILALAGCETPTPTASVQTAAPQAIRVSDKASPGSQVITAARAAQVFGDLCVRNLPNFAGIESDAAQNGFVWNSTFGTYYHPTENLSVKLVDGTCSMVFQSSADLPALQGSIGALSSRATISARSFANQKIYNARLSAG